MTLTIFSSATLHSTTSYSTAGRSNEVMRWRGRSTLTSAMTSSVFPTRMEYRGARKRWNLPLSVCWEVARERRRKRPSKHSLSSCMSAVSTPCNPSISPVSEGEGVMRECIASELEEEDEVVLVVVACSALTGSKYFDLRTWCWL